MWKIIKHYYYYVFFNAYWTSFDIGESTIPRQNAVFYMSLLEIFFVGGISFILYSFDLLVNLNLMIIGGVGVILLLNYLTLSKAIFEDKYDEYEFLSKKNKGTRLILFFAIIVGAGLVNIIGAFLFSASTSL